MNSKRQKSGTEATELPAPGREQTAVWGGTLPTPHSGVRIPAARTEQTSDKFPLFSTSDQEVTVCDERTTLGLFVVPREPRTEPHLPVADPFEVAEQLSAIEDAAIPPPPSSATRFDVTVPTFEDSGPPSETMCSVGVVRSESEIIAAPKVRSSSPPPAEVVIVDAMPREPAPRPPPVQFERHPLSNDDKTSLTLLGLPRPVFAPSRFAWLMRISEWVLAIVTFGRTRR